MKKQIKCFRILRAVHFFLQKSEQVSSYSQTVTVMLFWRWLHTLWAAAGNCQPFSVKNFCDVKVEKVHVQNSLDAASDDGDLVDKVLVREAPVPVNDVQSSVSSLEE